MITNLRKIDAETVVAFGQKFDTAKATAVMWAVTNRLLKLVSEEAAAVGSDPPQVSVHLPDRPREPGTVDGAFSAFVDYCAKIPYEACSTALRLHIGRYAVMIEPSGSGSLHEEEGMLVMDDDRPAQDLDAAPCLSIFLNGSPLWLSDHDKPAVREAFALGATYGAEPDLVGGDIGPIPVLKFPHKNFGDGEGEFRIRLIS